MADASLYGTGWARVKAVARDVPLPVLGAAWILAFLIIGVLTILDMRSAAWHESGAVTRNILDVAARNIERDIEIYDLSIQAVVTRVARADVRALPPELRRMAVFDNSAQARGLGRIHYTDAKGAIADTSSGDPSGVDVSDRDYFVVHRDNPHLGLFVGNPITGRIGKERYITLSRRIDNADGSFGGVTVGQIKLSYLRDLFRTVHLGAGGEIGLYAQDGTVVVREPMRASDQGESDDTVIAAPWSVQQIYGRSGDGEFVTPENVEAPSRLHAFTHLVGRRLVLDVSVSTDVVLAGWRSRASWMALVLAGLVLTLCHFMYRYHRELALRRAAEQAAIKAKGEAVRLSETDALTGLQNRRVLDRTMALEVRKARSTGTIFSVVTIDADRFKRLNDTHGHAVGDDVLKAIAREIGLLANREGETACRVGGEEFAVVLPGMDADDAAEWAEVVRGRVKALRFECPAEGVTVSMGVAEVVSGETAAGLLERADAALYAAKASGRDRVQVAGSPQGTVPLAA